MRADIQKVQSGRYAPRLIKLVPLLVIAFALAALAILFVFIGLAKLDGYHIHWLLPHPQAVKSKDLSDLVRDTATIAAVFGAVFAGVYAYRKQRVEEAGGHRADAESLSKRYQAAAEQLGHEKAAVRLAGVYAMARLADEWPEQRQTCVDVLCAYLRMPKASDAGYTEEDSQVRSTIISAVTRRLKADASVPWHNLAFDFSDVTLKDVSISPALYSVLLRCLPEQPSAAFVDSTMLC
jgi:hypothetical protein